MSFLIYDLTFLVLFSLFVFIFLYKRRKNLKREGIMYLYRTQIGIKFIDYIGEKYSKLLGILRYFVVIFGFTAMITMFYLLLQVLIMLLRNPEIMKIIKIPPIAPLIPYLPQIFHADYLPAFYFTYWIIVIAVVAIVHEFSHGIFARYSEIEIKSTGFAFLGPFLGAFVEPDEKQMNKKSKFNQLSILASGTFANAVFCIIFFIILLLIFYLTFIPSGAIFDTYYYTGIAKKDISLTNNYITVNGVNMTEIISNNSKYYITQNIKDNFYNLSDNSVIIAYYDMPAIRAGLQGIIISVDNHKVRTYKDLGEILKNYKPNDTITITTYDNTLKTTKDYIITLRENPENKTIANLGIGIRVTSLTLLGKVKDKIIFFRDANTYYAPLGNSDFIVFIYYLFWWLAFINFSVALANMLPAGIFDGGKFFYLGVLSLTKSKKIAKIAFKISTYLILLIILLLVLVWIYSYF